MVAPVAIGLGEILWDLLPEGKCLGGAPANFAFHAGQLGCEAYPVSAVGDDALGREIEATLDGLDLSRDGLRRVAAPTGTVTVTLTDGQPEYTIHTGVAWDNLPYGHALAELAARADVICFGSLAQRAPASKESVLSFVDGTRPDCWRIFDINLRQHYYDAATIEDSLIRADALKLNDAELPVVARLLGFDGDEAQMVEQLRTNFDLRLVALTRGGDGSALYGKHRVSERAVAPTTVADTVGAGDAFTAALAWGLLHYEDLDRLHDRASALASLVCAERGATPRFAPEVLDRL